MNRNFSILNNINKSHKEFLIHSISSADRIIFAVGFLKQSGFDNISKYLQEFCSDNSKSSTFYIGTGLGETEPKALQQLFKIIQNNNSNKLVLCTPDAGIFHPKIYVFITGEKVTIVIGSSNMTNHGWEVNDEVSMIVKTTINSTEFLELKDYFQILNTRYYTDNIYQLILNYKKSRDEYLKKYPKTQVFRFRPERSNFNIVDMPRLHRYFEIYKNSNYFIKPGDREIKYSKAKQNLDILASNRNLTQKQFHNYFGPLVGHKGYKPKLWHSGSIHRTTYKTLKYPDSFRKIVRSVKQNLSIPVDEAFNNVITLLNNMKASKNIYGVGINIITEILMSYNPQKFANLNDNPISVLSFLGKDYPMSNFKGKDYNEYVNLLDEIRVELKMETFLEIDSFFNYVYWFLLEE